MAAADARGLRAWLRERRKYYLKRARRPSSPGRDLTRIHQKVRDNLCRGLPRDSVQAIPLKQSELRAALLTCEGAHINHVAQFLSRAPAQPSAFSAFRACLAEHRDHFIDLRGGLLAPNNDPAAVPGFINEHGGQLEFLFLKEQFDAVVGDQAAALKRELRDKKLLDVTGAGKQGIRHVVKRQLVKGSDRHWVVAVSAKILED